MLEARRPASRPSSLWRPRPASSASGGSSVPGPVTAAPESCLRLLKPVFAQGAGVLRFLVLLRKHTCPRLRCHLSRGDLGSHPCLNSLSEDPFSRQGHSHSLRWEDQDPEISEATVQPTASRNHASWWQGPCLTTCPLGSVSPGVPGWGACDLRGALCGEPPVLKAKVQSEPVPCRSCPSSQNLPDWAAEWAPPSPQETEVPPPPKMSLCMSRSANVAPKDFRHESPEIISPWGSEFEQDR